MSRIGPGRRAGPASSVGRAATVLATGGLVLTALALAAVAAGAVSGRWRVVPVRSGSMAPTLAAGDAAIAVPVPAATLAAGDVLVFHAPVTGSPVVVHRVTEVVDPGARPVLRTSGDANPADDPWLARVEDPVAWKVRTAVPFAGYLALAVDEPALRTGLLAGAAAALSFVALRWLWRPAAVDHAAAPSPA